MQEFEEFKTETRDAMTPDLIVSQDRTKSPSKKNKQYVDGEENIQDKSNDYNSEQESYYEEYDEEEKRSEGK